MHRLYCSSQNILADKIIISDIAQIHHLRDVLRLKPNDEVIVFDNKGNEYITKAEKIMPKSIILNIKDKHHFISAKDLNIAIACAIPKKSKMDDIVDKLTQLGVDRIIPLETERVIVRLDRYKKILRQKRWEKIALNASQQSRRNTIPIVEPVRQLREVLSTSQGYDLKLLSTLTGERKLLAEVLENHKPKNILVLVGPEGDFTQREVNLAKKAGCIPVSLGDLVLRIETAVVAITSFLLLRRF